MIFLIILIANLYFSNILGANANSYFNTEIQSIIMLMKFEQNQNNFNKKRYKTDKIDDCRSSINTIEKSVINTFEVDICKRIIKKKKFIP